MTLSYVDRPRTEATDVTAFTDALHSSNVDFVQLWVVYDVLGAHVDAATAAMVVLARKLPAKVVADG